MSIREKRSNMAFLGCVHAATEHHKSFLSGENGWGGGGEGDLTLLPATEDPSQLQREENVSVIRQDNKSINCPL